MYMGYRVYRVYYRLYVMHSIDLFSNCIVKQNFIALLSVVSLEVCLITFSSFTEISFVSFGETRSA